uniref:U1-type domain-containing protein n=1 Tax=Aegilops tauschii subsp. strangulata TaxID=200361 RepID=A0A453EYU2_AEGTS
AGETLDCALHLFLPRIASPQPKTLAHAPCRSGPETHSGNLRNAAMVWFQCEDCGENLKKPKLAGHFRSCSAYKLSCIDCGAVFGQGTVQTHTQCISEAEKYGPKGLNKPSSNAQGKPDKPKPNADVDINVGLSTRPPWFCSLCNTTTTSKQTLLGHADGRKHRAKAKAFHASQKQEDGAEQTPSDKETGGAPTTASTELNDGKGADSERDADKDVVKRKRTDSTTSEEPDNAKRQNSSNLKTGEAIQSENGEAELKTKSKSAAEELVNGANHQDIKKQKIKWKKIITKILETVKLYSMLLLSIFCSYLVLQLS